MKTESPNSGSTRMVAACAPKTLEECLAVIVAVFGVDCLKDRQKTLGLLADLSPALPSAFTLSSRFFDANGSESYFDALKKAPGEQKSAFEMVVLRLTSEQFLAEDAARKVCSAFWTAIGGSEMVEGNKKKAAPARSKSVQADNPAASKRKKSEPANLFEAPKRKEAVTSGQTAAVKQSSSQAKKGNVPTAGQDQKTSAAEAEEDEGLIPCDVIVVYLFHAVALAGLFFFPRLTSYIKTSQYAWFLAAVILIDVLVFVVRQKTVNTIGSYLFGAASFCLTLTVESVFYNWFVGKSLFQMESVFDCIPALLLIFSSLTFGDVFRSCAAACSAYNQSRLIS